jgi:hypothetical protein
MITAQSTDLHFADSDTIVVHATLLPGGRVCLSFRSELSANSVRLYMTHDQADQVASNINAETLGLYVTRLLADLVSDAGGDSDG